MAQMQEDLRKVKTPEFRMSFPYLLEPRAGFKGNTERRTYGVEMLFPPKTNMTPFRDALTAAVTMKFGDNRKDWPRLGRTPKDVLRDFGEFNSQAKTPLDGDWDGWIMVRANCSDKVAPYVVGPVKNGDGIFPRITDPREIYGGRWAKAVLQAYYYPGPTSSGVTFGLVSVQLLKHDSHFGVGRSKPEQDFENATEEWSGQSDDYERGVAAPKRKPDGDNEW
jgi:hypothetical protein